jgi:hypothetical protein
MSDWQAKLREWETQPEDDFEFFIGRKPEERRPEQSPTEKAIQWLFQHIQGFVLSRVSRRVERGQPADQFTVKVTITFHDDDYAPSEDEIRIDNLAP